MKKVIILFISVLAALNFIGCEADAKTSDFLSTGDIQELLGEDFIVEPDIGILDPPLPIIRIDDVFFVANQQIAFLTQSGLTIIFVSVDGDELKLSIANPATQTYTSQLTSTNSFVAQYTIGDGDAVYTTLPSAAPGADGALGLIYNGSTVSSEFFRFDAFISGTTDEVKGTDGKFEDVEIIDQR